MVDEGVVLQVGLLQVEFPQTLLNVGCLVCLDGAIWEAVICNPKEPLEVAVIRQVEVFLKVPRSPQVAPCRSPRGVLQPRTPP